MLFILSRLLRFLCGFVPVLPMMAVYHLVLQKTGRYKTCKAAAPHFVGVYLFCLYSSGVFFMTDIPDVFHFALEPSINLIPFDDLFTNTNQYFLNILLFVPFGLLLPMLWNTFRSMRRTLLCGAVLSLFIELIQLFNYRATDVDDLLMNTAGTIVGYFFYRWVMRLSPNCSVCSVDDTRHCRGEAFLCVFFAWVSAFFIQPVFSGRLLGYLFNGRVIIG